MKLPPWLSILDVMRWGSIALVTLSVMIATWAVVADEHGMPYRYWGRYTASLERRMRTLFVFTPGRVIAIAQLSLVFVIFTLDLVLDVPLWWVLVIVVLVSPTIYLESERRKRVALIEDQLDTFCLALANALKATPSIGAAFLSVVDVVDDPIKKEVDLAIKEMKIGSTLDQALLHMASRVGSRPLDSALSSILIGRQVGGNLPKVLETTGVTLREMKRLEGIVRTKTADGRMQMWVIGAFPAVVLVLFSWSWPGYFQPLTESATGYTLIMFISGAWVSALLLARKVLAVDY